MAGLEKMEQHSNRSLWFLLGFLSIGSQVIMLRAAIVVFSGNEMIIGPTLFAWTIWIAVGSLLGGKWGGAGRSRMHLVLGIAAALLPVTYFAVQLAKVILGLSPAVLVSPLVSFAFMIAVLAPLCILLGAAFSIGCRLSKESAGKAVARTYLWDALGAAAGGLITGGLLLPVLSSSKAVFLLMAVTTCVLAVDARKTFEQSRSYFVVWTVMAIAAFILIFWNNPAKTVNEIAWRGYPIVEERDSRYSHLMMVQREGEYTLFVNGSPALTYPGGPSDETLAYLALTTNPWAKRVLLIGGGMTTVGAKLLDGPIERLDYCQIDPVAIEMEKRIPSPVWKDKRIHLHIEDGRQYIRNASPKTFDLIVLDVGDPDTLAQNRYYTKEFFKLVQNALADKGTVVFGTGEYANYISDEQIHYLLSIFQSLGEVFEKDTVYPLDRFYFAATDRERLPIAPAGVIHCFSGLGIEGEYFRPEILEYDLSKDRYQPLLDAMDRIKRVFPNQDYWPLAYAFRTTMWLSQFPVGASKLKWMFSSFTPVPLIIFILALLVIQYFFRKKARSWGLITLIFGVGFAGIALEIMTLYAIQISLGGLYGYLGYVVTFYMVGLGIGSKLSYSKHRSYEKKELSKLRWASLTLMLFITLFYFAGNVFPYIRFTFTFMILTCLVSIISICSGLIFGSISQVRERSQNDAGKLGGLLNFADLLGAAFGALLIPTLMIPRWGFKYTSAVVYLIFVTAAMTGFLYFGLKRKSGSGNGSKA